MPHAQHRLQQPDDARGTLQVAHVGLGRADQQRLPRVPAGTERGPQPGGLDRVADPGAGAVQLHVLHLRGLDARPARGGPHQRRLRARAGHGQTVGGAVTVDRAAQQHGVHGVAVRDRPRQRLEHQQRGALTTGVAVGPGVEGEAAVVGRERAEPVHRLGAVGREVEVHPGGQGQFGLPRPQALHRQVDRHQGGGLGGVDGQARTAQVEGVGDPVGDDPAVQAGQAVPGDRTGPGHQRGVVAADRADEDTGPAPGQLGRPQARLLQRLPGEFEDEPLLRVACRRLGRREPEELGIETVHLIEVAARPGPLPLGEALRRQHADRARAAVEQPPERLRVRRTGQSAGETDNGHRLRRAAVRCGRVERFQARHGEFPLLREGIFQQSSGFLGAPGN